MSGKFEFIGKAGTRVRHSLPGPLSALEIMSREAPATGTGDGVRVFALYICEYDRSARRELSPFFTGDPFGPTNRPGWSSSIVALSVMGIGEGLIFLEPCTGRNVPGRNLGPTTPSPISG